MTVNFDPVDDLVYWSGRVSDMIYRGLADDRYSTDRACFTEIFLKDGMEYSFDFVININNVQY